MESLFNTCHSLRDKLLAELASIKQRINPANNTPADSLFPVAYFNGVVLQTPGVNTTICFTDKQESKNAMIEFVHVVSDEFRTTVLDESDFDRYSKEFDFYDLCQMYGFDLYDLCEMYMKENNTIPATDSSVWEFWRQLMLERPLRIHFMPGCDANQRVFLLKLTRTLLGRINKDADAPEYDDVFNMCVEGSGLNGEWMFRLAAIIQKTLLLPQFKHVILSIDDVLLDVDAQGGKIDLLDFEGFMQTKALQYDNAGPYYQHMVSTGNAAFLEWKMFEAKCQGILQQTMSFAAFASGVQQALQGTLCNILYYHGAWPKTN